MNNLYVLLLGDECNSGTEFRELDRAGIERNYTELLGIPGIPSDSGIEWSMNNLYVLLLGDECNSGTEFRELDRAGIERNYTELLGIPGIPSNSQRFRTVLIPEFRTGIGSSLLG